MSKVIGVMKCKDSSVPDFMVTTMRLVDDNEGYVGIKDDGEEYHVYCQYWDFEPVAVGEWRYPKGSEKDFGGVSSHFRFLVMIDDRTYYLPSLPGNGVEYLSVLGGVGVFGNAIVGRPYQVIAQREPVTTADVEVVKYDPTKVDIESLVTERGNRYGKFSDGAKIMRALKSVMHNTDGWSRLTDSQREALDMIQHKIGRILNGDPNYDDNWKDIAGYSKLIADELNGDVK